MTTPALQPQPGIPDQLPSIRELGSMLWTQKWVVIVVSAIGLIGALLFTIPQPRVYSATCTIEYDPRPIQALGGDIADIADSTGDYWASREFFETQNQILRSRTMAERVVEQLSLHTNPGFFGVENDEQAVFEPASTEDAAVLLMGRIQVEQERETRLVALRVFDRDPERAQLIANTLAELYIRKTIDDRIGSTGNARDWLESRRLALRQDLERSENALHQFKLEHNLLSVSFEDSRNIVSSRYERFSAELTAARIQRIALEARARALRRLLSGEDLNPESAVVPELAEHATLQALRSEFRERVAEEQALGVELGAAHPQMVALRTRIESLRAQIRDELDGLVAAADRQLEEARALERGLTTALEEAHRQGLELNLREIEYARLDRERESHARLYATLLERAEEANLSRAQAEELRYVRIVDRAIAPREPVSPKLRVNLAIGGLVGLVLGVLGAFVLARMDRRVRNAEQIEAIGLTVVGLLPTMTESTEKSPSRRTGVPEGPARDVVVHHAPMSAAAESCRTIRTNLTFVSASRAIRTLVVTSAGPREGKTTVALNLAVAFAQSGKSVLIIDTDMRRPRVHRTFDVSMARGVSTCIVNETTLSESVQDTGIPNLHVLPCGPIPPNPSELLHHPRFAELLAEARETYDLVMLDSPPLGPVTDAAIVAPQVDAALLVVRADQTTRDAVAGMLRQLTDVSARVVGCVLNGVDLSKGGSYSRYYRYKQDGYAYASSEDAAAE